MTLDDLPKCGRGNSVKSNDFEAVALAIENIKKHGTLSTKVKVHKIMNSFERFTKIYKYTTGLFIFKKVLLNFKH